MLIETEIDIISGFFRSYIFKLRAVLWLQGKMSSNALMKCDDAQMM